MSERKKAKLVPDVVHKIKTQLQKLHLKAELPLGAFLKNKHIYHSVCQNNKGQKFFFKARLWDEEITKKAFANEVTACSQLNKIAQISQKKLVRKIFDWSLTPELDWALYEFLPGKIITKDNLNQEIINSIIQILKEFNNIPLEILPPDIRYNKRVFASLLIRDFHPEKDRFSRYKEETLDRLEKNQKELPFFPKLKQIINGGKDIVNSAPQILCHGDLNINNMLLKDHSISLIDWEYVQVNNFAYDLASIYTRGNIIGWESKLLSTYLKTLPQKDLKLFEESFRLMTILQITYKIYPALLPAFERAKEPKILIVYWKNILKKCTQDFSQFKK